MNSSRLVSLFLNVVIRKRQTQVLYWWQLLLASHYLKWKQHVVVNVTNQISQLLPDNSVHTPDLGCALQNAEGLGEGLGLVCRCKGCPVTTVTDSRAGVVVCVCGGSERSGKMDRHVKTTDMNTSAINTSLHACVRFVQVHKQTCTHILYAHLEKTHTHKCVNTCTNHFFSSS